MAGAQYVTIVNYLRKGKDGKDGEDGVVVRITPDTLVFSTDDNGEIKSSSLSQKAQIKVFKGSEDITASCTFADKNAVFVNCQGYVSKSVVGGSAVGLVQFSAINTAATVDGHRIPSTAGYANISIPCTLDGKTYTAQVKFTVDGGSFWGGLSSTSKGLVASYTSISDRVDSAEGKIDSLKTANGALTKRVGTLEVTSNRISAKVNQTEVRDRNLIPNSYVNQGSGIYGFCKRKVRLEKGKSYAMSIWGRIDATLSARGGSMRAYVYKENGSGTWTYTQYVDLRSTTDSKAETKWTHAGATGEYQFAVFPYPRKDDGGGKCFLQCAQIEKIEDAANGYGTAWSANRDDAVALGNILPDIRSNAWSFGNGTAIADDKAEIDGKMLDVVAGASSSSANLDVVDSGKVLTLGRGSVYTLSFWAQGKGSFNSYLYDGSNSGCSWAVRDDGNWSMDGNGAVSPDRTLTYEWTRYSVTFSVDTDGTVGVIPVQLRKNSMIAIAGLKLEPYGRATEYTNRAITTEEMLATGIDIFNRKVIVTADKFEVRNNLGKTTARVNADGVFETDDIVCNGGTFKNIHSNGGTFTDITAVNGIYKNINVTDSSWINGGKFCGERQKDGTILGGFEVGSNGLTYNIPDDWLGTSKGEASNIHISADGGNLSSKVGVIRDNNFLMGAEFKVNYAKTDIPWGTYNVAAWLEASGSIKGRNYAFMGVGHGVLRGMIEGISFAPITHNTEQFGCVNLNTYGNRWLFVCPKVDVLAVLPKRDDVAAFIASADHTWCLRVQVICSPVSPHNVKICGRQTSGSYNTTQVPQLYNKSSVKTDGLYCNAGNIIDILLVWDGTEYYALHMANTK
jgi:hypothetical protein